jgi:hypothetical protein
VSNTEPPVNSLCSFSFLLPLNISYPHYFNMVSKLFQHGIGATFLWLSTSLCSLAFHLTILVLKSTATLCPKLSTSSTSCASHASQVRCTDLITAQVGSFSFYFWAKLAPFIFCPCQPWLIFGPLLDFGPSLAPFKVWLIVSLGPLLTPFGVLAHCQPF